MKRMFASLLTTLGLTAVATAGASQISVSGFLEDASTSPSKPLEGTYGYRLEFYDGGDDDTADGIDANLVGQPLTGEVTLTRGVFSILVTPPEEALGQGNLHYRLAIDTDKKGLDEGDFFRALQPTTSVLFTQGAPASEYYIAHGGYAIGIGITEPSTSIAVAPFLTPAGGVRFDRMAFWVNDNHGSTISFGLYDEQGRLVIKRKVTLEDGTYLRRGIVEVSVPMTFLQPSKIYYTAYTITGNVSIGSGPLPAVPGYGVVKNASVNGELPNSFNRNNVMMPENSPPVLPLALRRGS